ncbi:hypothetical protein V6N13_061267 [Hibiscus sabdariffa]
MAQQGNGRNDVLNNEGNRNNNNEAPQIHATLDVNMEEERPIREHSTPNIDNLMRRLVGLDVTIAFWKLQLTGLP